MTVILEHKDGFKVCIHLYNTGVKTSVQLGREAVIAANIILPTCKKQAS